ncbi:MAG: hypothetical protein ACODAJ_07205 [Planctomycetota bacterium]
MRPLVFAALALTIAESALAAAPENLAPKATIAADSEYDRRYVAQLVADGVIPKPMGKNDLGRCWVVQGKTHGKRARITFTWPEPVTVAEIVYWGRTGWHWGENFRDYGVYLDGAEKPAAKGRLRAGHGGQRITLEQPARAKTLAIQFTSSYGGPNPGASEIQVFPAPVPEKRLGKFIKPNPYDPQAPPPPQLEESKELARRLKAGELGFTKLVLAQRHHIRCSHVYTYHCEGQRNGGGLVVYDVTDGSLKTLVDSTEGQISSLDLSYDGKTIVFSWRRKGSPYYQVYTIGTDGTGLRQITKGDCYNYDAAWLPDGRIVFLSTRVTQAAYCFFTPVGILYTMNADGSEQRKISANYLNDFTPAVLNDGRIIYGRWEYVDRPAIPIQSLWTLNPDGTMLQGFYGNRVLDPATFIEPQAIPGSRAVLCTLTGHNGSCRGAIGIIDPTSGNNAQPSIRNLTSDVRLRGVEHSSNGPRGPYQTPFPVDDRYFLVSYDGTLLLRDYERTEQCVVLAARGTGFFNPRPLRPRPRPPVRQSALPEEEPGPWAAVYVQDVYKGLEPHVKRGEVKQIAVVQEIRRSLISSPGIYKPVFGFQRILVSCGATYVPKKLWGWADVAEDGSAYFKVPAEQPVYFMATDAEGRAVQRMRSFTHLMPGETQGCIGCHESRSTGPQPSFPVPAVARQPQELEPPPWGVKGFDYASIVQPVLDEHCIQCHNPRDAPKGIDLTGDRTEFFNVSYEHLARRDQGREGSPYVSWIPTYNGHEWNIREITPKHWGSPASKLADLVLTGHPDEDGERRVRLGEDARRRILTWIDLNVPYYGTADTAHPDLPACRRLTPPRLRKVMDDVYARRCASCHDPKGGPRIAATWRPVGRRDRLGEVGLRVENPHLNPFLLAPLARDAGGTGRCGKTVFASKDDPDYRAVLATFQPVHELIEQTPRMDMPGAKPASCCLAARGQH